MRPGLRIGMGSFWPLMGIATLKTVMPVSLAWTLWRIASLFMSDSGVPTVSACTCGK